MEGLQNGGLHIASQLHIQWRHVGTWKLAVVGIFIYIMEMEIGKDYIWGPFFFLSPRELVVKIYQHTTGYDYNIVVIFFKDSLPFRDTYWNKTGKMWHLEFVSSNLVGVSIVIVVSEWWARGIHYASLSTFVYI